MKAHLLLTVTVLFAATIALGSVAHAELTPQQTKQAQALIGRFSHPEFAVRQQASQQLIKMGPDVLPLIKTTLAETKDDEVKRVGFQTKMAN